VGAIVGSEVDEGEGKRAGGISSALELLMYGARSPGFNTMPTHVLRAGAYLIVQLKPHDGFQSLCDTVVVSPLRPKLSFQISL
jgi:hypothetical protein